MDGTNNQEECLDAIKVALMGVKLSDKKLYLEGYSMIVVNGITKGSLGTWYLKKYIKQINGIL